jgi:hypothetical protein
MTDTSDAFALAREMATEIADALNGIQPYGKEEANILKDRYVALHQELITYERFVKADSEGYYFVGGFSLSEFDEELCFRLYEHAFKWNACPLCTACAIVILPGLLESFLNTSKKLPEVERQKQILDRYLTYLSATKDRQRQNSFRYQLKPSFSTNDFKTDISF